MADGTITWFACDFVSGSIITEFPSLAPQGPISRRLGTYTSTAFNLDLSGAAPDWRGASEYGRVLVVGVVGGLPIWVGSLTLRNAGSSPVAGVTASTFEGYLDRRYAGDMTYTATDLSLIAAGLLAPVQATMSCLDVNAVACGVVDDRTYADSDDKSVCANLTELMGVDGGPEWTVDPVWNSDRSGFRLLARIAPTIGTGALVPTAVFDYPGCVTSYEEAGSYEDGKGATVVKATGAGEGTDRAVSATYTSGLIAAGWPVYEYRWSPGSDISDTAILDSHAQAALALMESGASTWSLTAQVSEAPQLGVDWALGDAVRLVVAPGSSPGHPDGVDVTERAWSWSWDTSAQTVSPVLVEGT